MYVYAGMFTYVCIYWEVNRTGARLSETKLSEFIEKKNTFLNQH